jgi:hypothetical protein
VTEPNTEMDPRQSGIDAFLRSSMSASIPTLPPDFDQRVMRAIRRGSQPLNRYSRILLIGYALVSVVACAVIMRGQGLDWGPLAGMIVASLAMVAVARAAWRARFMTLEHGHKRT